MNESWCEYKAEVTAWVTVNYSPVLLWELWKVGTLKYFSVYSALPTSTPDWPLKDVTLLAVIVPRITASCQCITSHQRLWLNMLHSHTLKFKQPVTKHSLAFHTNTAAARGAVPAGRQLWRGLLGCSAPGNVTASGFRPILNILMWMEKQQCRGVWNCLTKIIFLYSTPDKKTSFLIWLVECVALGK